jgi:WD40 repeat protein
VVITLVAIEAMTQRGDAERQRNLTLSSNLALEAERLVNSDPELGVRLALIALDKSPTDAEAAIALRQTTHAFYPYIRLRADSAVANAASYSPNGERLVTGGNDGVAVLWDASTHRRLAQMPAKHGAIEAARYSAAGDRIAIGFEDGTVLLTDASLAAPRALLRAAKPVGGVAFSGDGKLLAAALGDGTVHVFAVDGSGTDTTLRGHQGPVLGVDLNADGSRVVSAGTDGAVRLWNLHEGGTGKILLDPSNNPENDVAFSHDGSRIMAVGDDRMVRFWNARTGAELPSVNGEGRQLNAGAFSADGRRFAAGGRDGVTRVWSTRGGPPVAVLRGQRSRVLDLGFGPTEDRVVSAAEDGTVWLWDAGRTQSWANLSETSAVDFNRDGRSIAGGSTDGTVRVWDPATGELQTSLDGPDGYTVGEFSPTKDTILITTGSRALLWPIATNSTSVAVHPRPGREISDAEFGSAERIVYVDGDGAVVVRDLASGHDVPLKGAPEHVYGAALSRDGRYVLAAQEGDPIVWRVDRPDRPLSELRGHRGPVNAISIGPDDRMVTSGSDGTARVWAPTGQELAVMRGNEDELTTAIFTADGTQVLTSGQDGSLRLFDARSGRQLAVVQSRGQLFDVVQSRDGLVATLGSGDVVRVFSCDFCGSLNRVRAIALSRSPRRLTPSETRQFLSAAG